MRIRLCTTLNIPHWRLKKKRGKQKRLRHQRRRSRESLTIENRERVRRTTLHRCALTRTQTNQAAHLQLSRKEEKQNTGRSLWREKKGIGSVVWKKIPHTRKQTSKPHCWCLLGRRKKEENASTAVMVRPQKTRKKKKHWLYFQCNNNYSNWGFNDIYCESCFFFPRVCAQRLKRQTKSRKEGKLRIEMEDLVLLPQLFFRSAKVIYARFTASFFF